jgi:hypothetical protein
MIIPSLLFLQVYAPPLQTNTYIPSTEMVPPQQEI